MIALDATLAARPVTEDSADAERVRYLRAMMAPAKVRLRMLRGEAVPFVEEAEGLFGVRPELVDLSAMDPVIARIDALVPGAGTMAARWARFIEVLSEPELPQDLLAGS